jgi:hypothetical protein
MAESTVMKHFYGYKKGRRLSGFTLLEAMFAAMLIGLVIAALAASSGAFTMANGYGMDLSTSEFLIEEVREMMAPLPVVDPQTQTAVFGRESGETTLALYDDVDDFHNAAFKPPVDISRAVMNEFAAFTQQVTVENVNAVNLTTVVAHHSSDFVRVTVTILKNNEPLTSTSWIRARY